MAELWRQTRISPADEMRCTGHEDAAYIAGWVLSGAAVLGAVLLVWELGF